MMKILNTKTLTKDATSISIDAAQVIQNEANQYYAVSLNLFPCIMPFVVNDIPLI
jgi:hypothetical protein